MLAHDLKDAPGSRLDCGREAVAKNHGTVQRAPLRWLAAHVHHPSRVNCGQMRVGLVVGVSRIFAKAMQLIADNRATIRGEAATITRLDRRYGADRSGLDSQLIGSGLKI